MPEKEFMKKRPRRPISFFTLLLAGIWPAAAAAGESPEPLRAGMIGLDTSHVIAFTNLFNDPDAAGDVARVQITAGYPGGSEDIASSRDRVEGFTERLRDKGITIYDSIPAMLENVDVVLLESVDGRVHLEQVIPVFEAGLPVFIDKPLAGTLTDALAIVELAERYDGSWFSSSALRFSPGFLDYRDGHESTGSIVGVDSWGPASIEPTHPDLFWYGIHGVEVLFTILGPGCVEVTRVHREGTDLVVGVWEDGRIGSFRGIREGRRGFGATVFGSNGIARAGDYEGYGPLIEAMAAFFVTGEVPVDPAETINLFAFMEAADESRRRGGAPVAIETVLDQARAAVDSRLAEFGK